MKKKINIPYRLINNFPLLKKKDNFKLLVYYKKKKKIVNKNYNYLFKFFKKKDLLLRNNIKFIPSLLYGIKENTKSKLKIFLLKEINKKKNLWEVLVKPARKIRIGNIIIFKFKKNLILKSKVINNTNSSGRILKFIINNNKKLKKILLKYGKIKLPNIIKLKNKKNINFYQNVYSKILGTNILPNNSINLSKIFFLKLLINNIYISDITIYNNIYNLFKFKTIKDLNKNKNFYEKLIINKKNSKLINKTLKSKRKICALGIDILINLENIVNTNISKKVYPFKGWINNSNFIYKKKFNIINTLLTDFPYPYTFNFLILSNFCGGYDKLINIYNHAINNNYKLLSFGDMLLIK
ncbi:MAG: S-adenosylmethionine:tRNA ribosyltransferase-isomerase [Candidatus Shikimatogenerans bostrichidophilus]|nr:MAG: S-adenosylmethionine:tRNA ribosyltransferase-isomerase [Candidatus Shikimatogenerans bostrichidophilus]